MKLTRRNFLAWAGISATGAIACDLFDDELRVQSPALIPEDLVKGGTTGTPPTTGRFPAARAFWFG